MEDLGATGNAGTLSQLAAEDEERAESAHKQCDKMTEGEHTGHQTALHPKPDAVSKELRRLKLSFHKYTTRNLLFGAVT